MDTDRELNSVDPDYWSDLITEARAKVAQLPDDSPTRCAASESWLSDLASDVPPGIDAPPLLLHLQRRSVHALLAFDDDICAVEAVHPLNGEARSFLKPGRKRDVGAGRRWFEATFELAVQAHLLERLGRASVQISPELPNGRRADAAIAVNGRRIWIEITVLSDTDDLIESFDTTASVQTIASDPYHDARRVYRKVFDKVAGPVMNLRSQVHPDEPSIVMLGDAAWRSPGRYSLGYRWALDQLTIPEKRFDSSRASLLAWAWHDYWCAAPQALARLRHLSAVTISGFDLRLDELRANTAPDAAHRLSDDEVALLGGLLAVERPWSVAPQAATPARACRSR